MHKPISFYDGLGVLRTKTPVAEFHDEDGRVFYVVPDTRGVYDVAPPYAVIAKTDCE